MKTRILLLGIVFVPIVAWLSVCLAMSQSPVHEHSRRMNTDPAYLRKRATVLRLYSEGHTAMYHKNYPLAEKDFCQSLALDDMNGDIGTWADLGRTLDEEGRSAKAYAAYREAYDSPTHGGYSNSPNDVETLTHYGIMCEDNGQHGAAVRAYNKAVEELGRRQAGVTLDVPGDPKETPVPHLRALLDVMRGLTIGQEKNVTGGQDRSGEALEAFQEAAQQEPNDARVQYYLGYGFQKAGQFAAAQAAYGRASRLDTAGVVKAAAAEGARAAQARRR